MGISDNTGGQRQAQLSPSWETPEEAQSQPAEPASRTDICTGTLGYEVSSSFIAPDRTFPSHMNEGSGPQSVHCGSVAYELDTVSLRMQV